MRDSDGTRVSVCVCVFVHMIALVSWCQIERGRTRVCLGIVQVCEGVSVLVRVNVRGERERES